jgi:hypothetical protein
MHPAELAAALGAECEGIGGSRAGETVFQNCKSLKFNSIRMEIGALAWPVHVVRYEK